ncbi:hypothetical protein PHLGIDRAFT_31403 [Phlebiopsis gigantea 11061_1 CR5-6]|uniref:Uncharacterized protein n=1 Tax=Phlebiopsis gigantea (strain 11061_1 CR5-6) TaxID=745531 RepID=A0A0C3NHN1_PHLG1|nr:hypothetical protein PHLGIDRAFT_31403 [Phlebiopsis gigantea 11061_1 CR5-6]
MNDMQHDNTKGKNRAIERLDVEDDEHRHERMHDLLMQLDSKTAAAPQHGPRTFDFGERKTFMAEPPSALLSRVEAFLPQFAASTADITRRAQEDPDSVDIEKLGDEGRYIQMNLGLGVFEERKRGASSSPAGDSDTEMHGSESSATSSDSSSHSQNDESDSSSDGYDSDSSVDIISSAVSMASYRPIRPLPRRKSTRPQIVVLGDTAGKEDGGSPCSSGESQA